MHFSGRYLVGMGMSYRLIPVMNREHIRVIYSLTRKIGAGGQNRS